MNLSLLLAVLFASSTVLAQTPDPASDLTGLWRLTLRNQQHYLALVEVDGAITGSFHSDADGGYTFADVEGVRSGKKVEFFYSLPLSIISKELNTSEEDVLYTYSGRVNQDGMSGTVAIAGEKAVSRWAASRLPPGAAIPKPKIVGKAAPRRPFGFEPYFGRWTLRKEGSAINELEGLVATMERYDSFPWEDYRAALVIRWMAAELTACLDAGEYLGSKDVTVTLSFDEQPAQTEQWAISTDGKGALSPNAREFLLRCADAKQLVMRYTPDRGSPRTHTFLLTGSLSVVQKIGTAMKAAAAAAETVAPTSDSDPAQINVPKPLATPSPGGDPSARQQQSGLEYLRQYRKGTPTPGTVR